MDSTLRLALPVILFAGPAVAGGYACTYTLECIEAEACQETAYEVTLDVADDYATALLSSVSGDVETTAYNVQGLSYFAGYANSAMHLVSVHGTGPSRYSFQTATDTVMVITYLGTCEPTQ